MSLPEHLISAGWFYFPISRKGNHRRPKTIPKEGLHYFKMKSDTSLCGLQKNNHWKKDSRKLSDKRDEVLCPRCYKKYLNNTRVQDHTPMRFREPPKDNLEETHHLHKQTCPDCGEECIFLSNNENFVMRKRPHPGCQAA